MQLLTSSPSVSGTEAAAVPTATALGCLPWLLECSPAAALCVLQGRADLPPDAVLALLDASPCGTQLRWQYMYFLVYDACRTDAGLHTRLAVELVAAALQAFATAAAAAASAAAEGAASEGALSAGELRAMDAALPLLHLPNAPVGAAARVGAGAGSMHGHCSASAAAASAGGLGNSALAGAPMPRLGHPSGAAGSQHAGQWPPVAAAAHVGRPSQRAATPPPQLMGPAAGSPAASPALRPLPQLQQQVHQLQQQQQRQQQLAAGAASGGSSSGAQQPQQQQLLLLRSTLAYHLQASLVYDAPAVQVAIECTPSKAAAAAGAPHPLPPQQLLALELGLVLSRQGHHVACLRLWALGSGQVWMGHGRPRHVCGGVREVCQAFVHLASSIRAPCLCFM